MALSPFLINVDQSVLDDLRARLLGMPNAEWQLRLSPNHPADTRLDGRSTMMPLGHQTVTPR
jgi:hypothetical protein